MKRYLSQLSKYNVVFSAATNPFKILTNVEGGIEHNVLRFGVCYFALQIFQALDKIYRQNYSTKPLL